MILLFFFDLSQASAQIDTINGDIEAEKSERLIDMQFGENEKYDLSTGYEDLTEESPNQKSTIIPDNQLPRIRTQDGANLCQTFCTTALIEAEYCKQESFKDCRTIPDEKRISPISTIVYRDNPDYEPINSIASMVESNKKVAYNILDKISSTPGEPLFFSESCFPFDQFVERIQKKYNKSNKPIEQYSALKQFFSEIESIYSAAKKDPKSTEAATITSCESCAKLEREFNENFRIQTKPENIHAALKTPNFKRFLYAMLFRETVENNPKCKEIELKKKITFEHYPMKDSSKAAKPTSMPEAMTMVRKKISEGKPVLVTNICTAQEQVSKKCERHCALITGIKKVRHKTTKQEIELVRIHNSWGKEWQDKSNGGWISLDSLKKLTMTSDDYKLEKEDPDRRSKLFANTFSWVK